ncbi:GDSL-type esterase/lipase family protein [Psychrobacter aquaticus]|uniref:Acyl-CoA thioesterase I n=1 Tax=Psychrobacter aquaticus CMS 56 TaxID=1354303 RepID=U4T1J7_9GAMM|nr:GDSL-type esterase/lipase family protein [Psychrobacter aquaticus]ERL54612.1 Acyl-CoA thioesterase I [Psychrobacter aquaticus CMS 56]
MKFAERFLALVSVGLAASIGMTACSSEPQQAVLPAGSTVVALGDSLTYGYGTNLETAYPMVLAELSTWKVINAGVNGDTSADVLARVNEIVKQAPELVLLGVGGNDVLQRLPPDKTRANIIATIDTLKSANIDVVLIAEPYFSTSALFGKASDNPLYEDIASAQDVPLYSGGWSAVLSDDTLKSDRIHANQAGYRHFAEGLYEYLQDEGMAQ